MLFNRNLLYTGITRARNCVTILGSSETVRNMIDNVSENRRYTALEQRIREVCVSPRYAACGRKHEDIMAAAVPYEMSGV